MGSVASGGPTLPRGYRGRWKGAGRRMHPVRDAPFTRIAGAVKCARSRAGRRLAPWRLVTKTVASCDRVVTGAHHDGRIQGLFQILSMPAPPPNTLILSDLHLTEAEPRDPKKPLWKRFKRADLFIDQEVATLLQRVRAEVEAPAELVLNGDVFDFDAVTALPDKPPFEINWLERLRGLSAEQDKSAWKMQRILRDHPTFVEALRSWLADGHRVVFVIGNHDLELHWPAVQRELCAALGVAEDQQGTVRVCEWFYLSGGDTLITHGNQYDRYCVCQDPMHPVVEVSGKARIRLPFGDMAGKLMTNGMGLINPHVEESFIKPLREYLVFFYRYVARNQPLLLWTWFWSAIATLVVLLREGLRPALRDPLTIEAREEEVARKAQATPGIARALRAVDVHSAVFNPWMVARELWLDRAFLLLLLAGASFQLYTTLHVFSGLSIWWLVGFFVVVLVPFLFYAHSVESDTTALERTILGRLQVMARIARVQRVVMGHTHREKHLHSGELEYLNTGTWSPAFHDLECTQPFGRRCFAWLRPEHGGRTAHLYAWTGLRMEELSPQPVPEAARRPRAWWLPARAS